MPRADYEIFLSKEQELLPSHLFIQSLGSEPSYTMCFAKLRNSNTTFVESSLRRFPINHGVYIDIFPLDYYPDKPAARKKQEWRKVWYNRRIACAYDLPLYKTLRGKLRKIILYILMPSLKTVIRKRETLYLSTPESTLWINHGGAWGKREIFPAKWFAETVPMEFEGMELAVPKEYHLSLTQLYGDYMQPPPVEKRIGHHYVDVIDLKTPYTVYTEKQK